MNRFILCLFILLIDVVAMAQLPPYQRNPITTNGPSTMSNVIANIVLPSNTLRASSVISTNLIGAGIETPSYLLHVGKTNTINSGGGIVVDTGLAAKTTIQTLNAGGDYLATLGGNVYLNPSLTAIRHDTNHVAWFFIFDGRTNYDQFVVKRLSYGNALSQPMKVKGDGSFGIGGTSPDGASLSGAFVVGVTNGNIGIGTNAPTHKLHVAGDLRADGALHIFASENPTTNVNSAVLYSKTNSGIVELYARGSDGVETQISPHADDAPEVLYDRGGGMKEMIWRENCPFVTNGMVSFINLRRMARITELNTKAILYLIGNVTPSTSNAMQRLRDMSPDQRQVIITETYSEYNLRTTNSLKPVSWSENEESRQATYDLERANALAASNSVFMVNSELIKAGKTDLYPDPLVPPQSDIRRPKPNWIK